MPTIATSWSLGIQADESGSGTRSDWPVLYAALYTDTAQPQGATQALYPFVFEPAREADTHRVRRAIRRAVEEFGPTFDSLGDG
jgi:hypothetical protein